MDERAAHRPDDMRVATSLEKLFEGVYTDEELSDLYEDANRRAAALGSPAATAGHQDALAWLLDADWRHITFVASLPAVTDTVGMYFDDESFIWSLDMAPPEAGIPQHQPPEYQLAFLATVHSWLRDLTARQQTRSKLRRSPKRSKRRR